MAQLTKAQFETKYASAAGEFESLGNGSITGGTMQEYAQDIADSLFIGTILNTTTNIAGGTSSGTVGSLGTTPITLVEAPPAGYYINVLSITVSFTYGGVAYNFGASESPTIFTGGNLTGYSIDYSVMNGTSNFNKKLYADSAFTAYDYDNEVALTLGTADSGNATTGNGSLTVKVYYTIEAGV
jgi:hypothetical protein